MYLDEILHMSMNAIKKPYGFLIALSVFKDDFPWIYDSGKELLDILKLEKNSEEKDSAIREFKELIEFTCGHPMMREFYGRSSNDSMMYIKEMPYVLTRYLDDLYDV